jgi:hypothetical protein
MSCNRLIRHTSTDDRRCCRIGNSRSLPHRSGAILPAMSRRIHRPMARKHRRHPRDTFLRSRPYGRHLGLVSRPRHPPPHARLRPLPPNSRAQPRRPRQVASCPLVPQLHPLLGPQAWWHLARRPLWRHRRAAFATFSTYWLRREPSRCLRPVDTIRPTLPEPVHSIDCPNGSFEPIRVRPHCFRAMNSRPDIRPLHSFHRRRGPAEPLPLSPKSISTGRESAPRRALAFVASNSFKSSSQSAIAIPSNSSLDAFEGANRRYPAGMKDRA